MVSYFLSLKSLKTGCGNNGMFFFTLILYFSPGFILEFLYEKKNTFMFWKSIHCLAFCRKVIRISCWSGNLCYFYVHVMPKSVQCLTFVLLPLFIQPKRGFFTWEHGHFSRSCACITLSHTLFWSFLLERYLKAFTHELGM